MENKIKSLLFVIIVSVARNVYTASVPERQENFSHTASSILETLVSSVIASISNSLSLKMINNLQILARSLSHEVQSMIPELVQSISPEVSGNLQGLFESLSPEIISIIAAFMNSLSPDVIIMIPGFLNSLSPEMITALQTLVSSTKNISPEMISTLQSCASSVGKNTSPALFSGMQTLTNSVFPSVMSILKILPEKMPLLDWISENMSKFSITIDMPQDAVKTSAMPTYSVSPNGKPTLMVNIIVCPKAATDQLNNKTV